MNNIFQRMGRACNAYRRLPAYLFSMMLLTSCVDTVLLPDDKTVDEDFWKTKSDVNQMVMGAYSSMLSSSVMNNLIVWGDYRSDELVPVSSPTSAALTEINAVNIQTTNTYSNWASLYSVINDCNIVLTRAKDVMSIDPSYTEGDYLTDRSQMLALRSLCYFYLVRNFRDVPYSAHAYMNSSEPMNLFQSAPDSVLQLCINDLVEAEQNALDPTAFSDWRRKGLINRDAIQAILADIYLWRASVKHSANDYQQCVAYCDKVIDSKKANYIPKRNETVIKEYPLADGQNAFNELFVTQNADESIFELQYDGTNNSNTALCQNFFKYRNNSSTTGYMKASAIFGTNSTIYVNNNAAKNSDYRFWQNCFAVNSGSESFDVRKMITTTASSTGDPNTRGAYARDERAYDRFAQNYIFYRLSDVMLMKAEAMTQLAENDKDMQLRQAFNIVQYVNSRSIFTNSLSSDSLKWSFYNTKTSMENLVLNERLRELAFEGKRWYDLMRYNYRRVDGIDYTTTLATQSEQGKDFVRNSADMLNLLIRKYTSGGQAAASKMRTEPYLYMPVYQSEMDVNPNLKQNPVYSSGKDYVKNY